MSIAQHKSTGTLNNPVYNSLAKQEKEAYSCRRVPVLGRLTRHISVIEPLFLEGFFGESKEHLRVLYDYKRKEHNDRGPYASRCNRTRKRHA